MFRVGKIWKRNYLPDMCTPSTANHSQIYKFLNSKGRMFHCGMNLGIIPRWTTRIGKNMRRFAEGTERQGTPSGFTGPTCGENYEKTLRKVGKCSWSFICNNHETYKYMKLTGFFCLGERVVIMIAILGFFPRSSPSQTGCKINKKIAGYASRPRRCLWLVAWMM